MGNSSSLATEDTKDNVVNLGAGVIIEGHRGTGFEDHGLDRASAGSLRSRFSATA